MKRKGRADGRVEVKITVAPGVRKAFFGKTKVAAQRAAEAWLLKNQGIESPLAKKPLKTVSEWSLEWAATYVYGSVKEASFDTNYERPLRLYILPAIGNKFLTEIKAMDLQKILTAASHNHSRSVVKSIEICLHRMFADAYANDLVKKNPAERLTIPIKQRRSEKRIYDSETVQSIIDFPHKYNYIIRLMLECGLRRSEVCGLQWGDITDTTLTVNRAVTTCKGLPQLGDPKSETSERTIPISAALSQCLKNARRDAKANADTDYVCYDVRTNGSINPQHFQENRINPFYKDYSKAHELKDFPVLTAHEHRHTCGTMLYRETHDVYKVMTFLGHSSVEVTASTYVHPDSVKGISYKDYQ